MATRAGALEDTDPRYMPEVFIEKACTPSLPMTMTPPSPPMVPTSAISASAAAWTVAPSAVRRQMSRATVARMKYSPVPVAETAQPSALEA
ncbi:hypothetical protein LTR94_029881, partial [Friedmanniomyces endolithicus]